VRFGRSRSFKFIDSGTNRKRVCDFPLVRHSNLVTLVLSCTVSEILQLFVLITPHPIHPDFGGVAVNVKMLNVKAILVSKMTNHSPVLYK